ncbi:MAG TPA: septation protein SepH [Streptosporangiaceae bacterium]|nr:septation protein SepH [Streptosporangiaceae bacterium]
MQELRIVAVSEDGSYAVLAVPGRGGRFSLPIDDRLRIVARGQFSRLAQYEIEVESPLRPKEIQDRIRAGETAEEIADAAGVPIERVRRFEGPVLAERAYRAQEAQGASIRQPGDSGPGPRLGDIVAERLAEIGVPAEEAQWDSRKRGDNSWQVQLMFTISGRPLMAEWVFDPRRRHVTPADDDAARLSLPEADLAALAPAARTPARATVTPIGSRLAAAPPPVPAPVAPAERRPEPEPAVGQASTAEARQARTAEARQARTAEAQAPRAAEAHSPRAAEARPARAAEGRPAAELAEAAPEAGSQEPAMPQRGRGRKAAGGRSRRSSVPSWDEIMFGTSRQPE